MKYILALILIVLTINIHSQTSSDNYVPGKIIVKFKKEVNLSDSYTIEANSDSESTLPIPASVKKILKENKAVALNALFERDIFSANSTFINGNEQVVKKIYTIKIDESVELKEICDLLNKDDNVEYAEPDYYFWGLATTNDERLDEQWHLERIQAFDAWDISTGEGEIIAILDTGVDPNHPDLKDKILPGYDFVNNDNDANDDNMHGTHVAGIAAASTDNTEGIAGVAPGAMILPIKVLQSSGRGSSSDIIKGIEFAIENGATIINMSLGSSTESLALKDALAEAYNSATLVAAAGNNQSPMFQEGGLLPTFPASYPFVLGVESIQQNEKDGSYLSSFSNYDPTGPVDYTNDFGFNVSFGEWEKIPRL